MDDDDRPRATDPASGVVLFFEWVRLIAWLDHSDPCPFCGCAHAMDWHWNR